MSIEEGSQIALDRRLSAWVFILYFNKKHLLDPMSIHLLCLLPALTELNTKKNRLLKVSLPLAASSGN